MTYISKTAASSSPHKEFDETLRGFLGTVVKGLGLQLLDLSVSRRKGNGRFCGSVQARLTVYKGLEPVSVDDCSRVHKAVLPRLELAFRGGQEEEPGFNPPELYVEVSSPGIDRQIREGREFAHFTGREVRCYRTDISDWSAGLLVSSDEEGIVLKTGDGELRLKYGSIGKAKLGHM